MVRFPLVGRGGETVDLWRTFLSHGVASLPPNRVDERTRTLETTLAVDGSRPRTVKISSDGAGHAVVRFVARAPAAGVQEKLLVTVRHVLRLDADLSEFYSLASSDAELKWATSGAGRMIRSPTVFEDVVKTLCTTNCSWSATERMVGALVEHLGEKAVGAPPTGIVRRTFPSAEAMADAGEGFYRDVARAGYRGPYLLALSRSVAEGSVDLEALARAAPDEVPDDEVARRLQELPGVGPYAAAHVMLMLGRYSPLILDSWTRPKYARLTGRRKVSDAAIQRRFRRYGRYAGLAFWLYVTRDWVTDDRQLEEQAQAHP